MGESHELCRYGMRCRRHHHLHERQVARDLQEGGRPHRQEPLRLPLRKVEGDYPPPSRNGRQQRLYN